MNDAVSRPHVAGLVLRHLADGEEDLFASMPDPLPSLPQISYADGVAGGGYHPSRTWIALRDGRVVGRAAWLLPPGAVGTPWLERFDLAGSPADGAALLWAAFTAMGGATAWYASMPAGWRSRPDLVEVLAASASAAREVGLAERGERLRFRWTPAPRPESPAAPAPAESRLWVRPAAGADEIEALVARIPAPDLLTGAEVARLVAGVDLARRPLDWLRGGPAPWRIALNGDEPVGLTGPAGDACYPMVAYLGVLDPAARPALLADAVATLAAGGALEVVADVDATNAPVIAELGAAGFVAVRSRILFAPAAGSRPPTEPHP
ncbi:acetyltransferase [Actinoplanes sp. CA-030573]|uniref:acetyltransferase n=1 Tax=Actinoplanes sp. CA-030573 TaxID=3239898 RepID=UPI003D91273A